MVVEHLVKRTVYVAQCICDKNEPWRDVVAKNAPREKMCPKCGKWCAYHEESALSPEYKMLLE